jgi:hypothetical protein
VERAAKTQRERHAGVATDAAAIGHFEAGEQPDER